MGVRLVGRMLVIVVLGLFAPTLAVAQVCACGAPCTLLLESDVDASESVTACNSVTVIGAAILASGFAEIEAGETVTVFNGFVVETGGELSIALDSSLSCDPTIDADSDGVDECLDCDELDENNWTSCGSCVDGDGDLAWTGCDAYVTLVGPDCDDDNASREPGAVESCNSIDDNCDGLIDECLVCTP